MTTAAPLHTHGLTNISTADRAASALAPLVRTCRHARVLTRAVFALGIAGAGQLAVPILAGSAGDGVAEALHWREGLERRFAQARGFYGVIAAATVVGLLILSLGADPIQALIYAAVINGVVAVPLLALILLVANNRRIMGRYVNGALSNAIAIIATLAMGAAAVATIVPLWWH